MIISGGFNVYPAEIEAAIDAVEGVAESAVIGVPHPDFGEGVTAVVVCKPGIALSEEDVVAPLKDILARFKQPKRVLFVDALPRHGQDSEDRPARAVCRYILAGKALVTAA